jgi:hypothetical protein
VLGLDTGIEMQLPPPPPRSTTGTYPPPWCGSKKRPSSARTRGTRGTGRHRAYGGMPPRRRGFYLPWQGRRVVGTKKIGVGTKKRSLGYNAPRWALTNV